MSQARNSGQDTVLLQTHLGVKYDGQKITDFLREDSKVDWFICLVEVFVQHNHSDYDGLRAEL